MNLKRSDSGFHQRCFEIKSKGNEMLPGLSFADYSLYAKKLGNYFTVIKKACTFVYSS